MTNLTRFDQDGIELVINTVTGTAYVSQAVDTLDGARRVIL